MEDAGRQEGSRFESASIAKIATALAEAQGKLKDPEKSRTAVVEGRTKTGKTYKYTYQYATLQQGLEEIRKVLSEHQIATTQPTFINTDGRLMLWTRLLHSSGEWLAGEYPVANLQNQNLGPQDIGGGLTYARRYALNALVGIAPETDDDDDANAASGNQVKVSDTKRAPKSDDKATVEARQLYDTIRQEIREAETIDRYHEIMSERQKDIEKIKDVTESGYDGLMAEAAKRQTDLQAAAAETEEES